MSVDQLASDGPVGSRRPLRARGCDRAAQRPEVGYLDAVVEAGHAAARHELQAARPAPFRAAALHRAGGQIEARLKSRQPDIGGVDIPQRIVGLPPAVERHAALAQRNDASLTLLGGTEIGTARARRAVERPRAVALGLPLRPATTPFSTTFEALSPSWEESALTTASTCSERARPWLVGVGLLRRWWSQGRAYLPRCIDPGRPACPGDSRRSKSSAPPAHWFARRAVPRHTKAPSPHRPNASRRPSGARALIQSADRARSCARPIRACPSR